ncbi:MAG: histidinol dehydrogenase, partial [Planctomycetaceae bacterium]
MKSVSGATFLTLLILEFQQAILHRDVEVKRASGAVLRQRYLPLSRVGVCVPGGAAAYPST